MQQQFARPDWWNAPTVGLQHAQREQVDKAAAKLARWRPAFGTGHVVAELTLGFWTGLLGRGQSYEHRFWVPALRRAFPGYRGSRAGLHSTVESLRLFRNRIAHHEPIFPRHLVADHQSILAVGGYLAPDVRIWIDSHSRVPATSGRRQRCIAAGDVSGF